VNAAAAVMDKALRRVISIFPSGSLLSNQIMVMLKR
jgi:hypothetical protein